MEKFTFIDLFSGIGGFHQAMCNLGGKCVLASEIDEWAIDTYKENYNIDSKLDVTKLSTEDIPDHDVLCAGFPCQAFSKAGKQLGFADKTKGTLFFHVARIINDKKPKYIILENVRNLISHDHGNTWRTIRDVLIELGYVLTEKPIIISPHQIGVPQLRERVYILGIRMDKVLENIKIDVPQVSKNHDFNIFETGVLDIEEKGYKISKDEEKVLNAWDEFYKGINLKIIGFPIWASEFNNDSSLNEFPKRKQEICLKNRKLYNDNKKFIDKWLKKYNYLKDFRPTDTKFEWQAGKSISSVWEGIIQFRPSGIRVKKPNVFPALVAIVQIPIIGPLKRRLSPREAARLQSFPDSFIPNKNTHQAYKQFGNAVNVKCVEFLAKQLFKVK